jgi:hypothetical protein
MTSSKQQRIDPNESCGSKKDIRIKLYTQGHERYIYLLGIEVGEGISDLNLCYQENPQTTYAMARSPKARFHSQAWTEFFYERIPLEGYRVIEERTFTLNTNPTA